MKQSTRSNKPHLPAGTRWRRMVRVVKQLPGCVFGGGEINLLLP